MSNLSIKNDFNNPGVTVKVSEASFEPKLFTVVPAGESVTFEIKLPVEIKLDPPVSSKGAIVSSAELTCAPAHICSLEKQADNTWLLQIEEKTGRSRDDDGGTTTVEIEEPQT